MKDEIVIDASVLAKAIVREEDSDKALNIIEAHTDGKIELVAPSLIIYEIGNVLWRSGMNGRSLHKYIENILSLGIKLINVPFERTMLKEVGKISTTKDLTFYDASYLSIAIILNKKLVTVDKEIMKKAGEYVISMEEVKIM